MVVPGTSRRLPPSEKAQATRMTKAGLRNSEGWTPKIQRREPFTSWPNSRATTISPMAATKTITAVRRTWRGVRNETAISTATAGRSEIACRLTKWKVGRPMRSATGGLAAMVRIIPATISVASVASSQRSTVHHQFARTVRCARETIGRDPFRREHSGRELSKTCARPFSPIMEGND